MTYTGPTIDSEGNYWYDDGGKWEPYVWKKGEPSVFTGEVYDHDAPDHSRMVAELLLNEVLFCNSRHYLTCSWSPPRATNISDNATLVCFVNCNDVFAWACSDAEEVSLRELPALYDMWKANPTWGATQWCILKRKQRPQTPVLKAMKDAGAWTEQMEAIK